jgi:HAD superfamily hydrolase (TIGR01549 family)
VAKILPDPSKILVIFDLDFTLIDNSYIICKSFEFALRQFNVELPNRARIIKKIGIPLKEMFLEYLEPTEAERAVLAFREYYGEHFFEKVQIIPGAVELLETLSRRQCQLALLTSKKTALAKRLLQRIGFAKYFKFILGEQQEFKPKPDPASLYHIISHFPNIEKAYMIGDHLVDCQAARRAGINFIGVLTGNTPEVELQSCAGEGALILASVEDIVPENHLK